MSEKHICEKLCSLFANDPCGLIPDGFATGVYKVIGYNIIGSHLYVNVECTEEDGKAEFSYKYPRVLRDAARLGVAKL